MFFKYRYFGEMESTKVQLQGIYESNGHSFQDVLVFKNLVIHTHVWIKNEIAQYTNYLNLS